jgi:hypothetical protein
MVTLLVFLLLMVTRLLFMVTLFVVTLLVVTMIVIFSSNVMLDYMCVLFVGRTHGLCCEYWNLSTIIYPRITVTGTAHPA